MNIAVILTGRTGIRLEKFPPKQFYKFAGRTVIEQIIDVLERLFQPHSGGTNQ
jgi:hypothetical protein